MYNGLTKRVHLVARHSQEMQAKSHDLLLGPVCSLHKKGTGALSDLPLLFAIHQTTSGSDNPLTGIWPPPVILGTGLCVFHGRAVSEVERKVWSFTL